MSNLVISPDGKEYYVDWNAKVLVEAGPTIRPGMFVSQYEDSAKVAWLVLEDGCWVDVSEGTKGTLFRNPSTNYPLGSRLPAPYKEVPNPFVR